jgi:L-lysine 6-transaminase
MIHPQNVHETLKRHQLADGLPLVFDLERSHGPWLFDSRTQSEYLDLFTCFASWPIGYNHPRMSEPAFQVELLRAASVNPSNSDLYTVELARFVEAFATRVTPPGFPHHFWISGGALAVENGMKVAFDWKAQKLGRKDFAADCDDLAVLHFRQAFHGRSGYTLSVTNTDPLKIGLFPKFRWPRIDAPALAFDEWGRATGDVERAERASLEQARAAFADARWKIAAILIEPMQGEGGDNHFRPEFFEALRGLADEREALLIYDEVQTGFFSAGTPWLWQQKGVPPDLVCFGKKSQVCGLYASRRVEEVEQHAFKRAGRINSTWGGNLADMVRARQMIDIILSERMPERVAQAGERMLAGLRAIARATGQISNVRGVASLIAFTLPSQAEREALLKRLLERRVLALRSGERSLRFRMPFVMGDGEVDFALEQLRSALPEPVRA